MNALAAIILSLATSQAWTRDQGSAYVNLSVITIAGEKAHGADFETIDILPYRQTTIIFYGEVGLVDRWLTLQMSSELLRYNVLENQGSTRGLGDTRVGLWSGLVTEPFHLSAGLVAGLPTGDSTPHAGEGADLDAQLLAASLPTGDGEWDLEPKLAFGTSFLGGNYFLAESGFQIRTRDFADAIDYRLEVGLRAPVEALDRFLLIVRFFGTESLASTEEVAEGFSGLGNGVTHTSIGAAVYAQLVDRLGISIGADTALRARGVVAGVPLKLALSWEL